MDKQHRQRVESWNVFKEEFPSTCQEISKLKGRIDSGQIYHSTDFDDEKKAQVVLAFLEKPINTFRRKDVGLKVETEWGCRLIYELNYNGSVSCRIRDYTVGVYPLSTYRSAASINKSKICQHIRIFFLVERVTSEKTISTFLDNLKFRWLVTIRTKSFAEKVRVALVQVPILKDLIKALSGRH